MLWPKETNAEAEPQHAGEAKPKEEVTASGITSPETIQAPISREPIKDKEMLRISIAELEAEFPFMKELLQAQRKILEAHIRDNFEDIETLKDTWGAYRMAFAYSGPTVGSFGF